jgi:hypothetical protein
MKEMARRVKAFEQAGEIQVHLLSSASYSNATSGRKATGDAGASSVAGRHPRSA